MTQTTQETNMSNNTTDLAHGLIDQTAQSAGAAIQTTQRVANDAVGSLSKSLNSAQHKVRESAYMASDKTVAYIREEPVKSMLIAAATGAALMAVARAISQPRESR